ncbi:MAG: hypothetical protein HOK56_11180 [Deltaproteobacteria bacterium]|jgi:hypothetical protein|nr:hypothetical protein [Deltaproteobacteria bacterium]
MYPETAYQKKIIAAKNYLRIRNIVRCSFAVVIFGWVFVNCINLGFAQTEDTTVEGISKNNNVRKINIQKPQPEAKYHIVYHTKNLRPLPFNNPRFKPVYTGTISPENSKKSRKVMTVILEKSISSNPLTKNMPTSKFYLKEKRQNTEAKHNIVYYTKNLAPLPFNNTRYKPVYTGTISPEDSEKTRNAMTMMLEKSISSNPLTKMLSSSKFYLKEQKQKDREKNKREMQVYNERKNKKFNEYFKRLQQKRSHSANYSGRHFDYTSYNQNIQVAASR